MYPVTFAFESLLFNMTLTPTQIHGPEGSIALKIIKVRVKSGVSCNNGKSTLAGIDTLFIIMSISCGNHLPGIAILSSIGQRVSCETFRIVNEWLITK